MSTLPKSRFGLAALPALYQRHSDFILLLILFVTFRVLALAAFRPGGLVLDFSDFYWYRSFAELTRQGYYPYHNLWTTYPPLFPGVMIAIYQLSTLLPPWTFPNLWFTLLLGGFFLLFEIGNFVLLYLFALKIEEAKRRRGEEAKNRVVNDNPANENPSISNLQYHKGTMSPISNFPIRVCWIYATLFVPVYTLTGWFESYPLFFFLLSLYLLLQKRPYLSAFFTGIGFMIKLIPLILMPVAIQQLSKQRYEVEIRNKKLEIRRHSPSPSSNYSPFAIRHSSFTIPFDLPRIALYLAIFLVTVIVIALPFYLMNPALILGSQQITGARQPWETVWALIDGNYDYGVIPLDMRDLSWTPGDAPPTRIPWLLVTALFGLVYAYFYTRRLDWTAPRPVLAFVGFTLCLFMLWSKGYSPQWLGWPLFFMALLLPNLRGVLYAVILSLANIVEANFFFIMFPEERWLFAATVLIRTFLLIVLAIEFLWLIWPQAVTPRVEKVRAWSVAVLVTLLLAGAVPAGWQLGRSYFDTRLRQSPYAATITRLQGEQVKGALLLNSHAVYDWFYPYLRHDYQLFMLDDYAPPGQSVETQTTALLDTIARQTDVLWLYDADAAVTTPAEETLTRWLNNRPPAHQQDIDGGRLYLFIMK
ncbi:MAG: hypothetical protein Fur0044_29440 [Anaerolineae bacterium]